MQKSEFTMPKLWRSPRRWPIILHSAFCILISAFLVTGCAKAKAASVQDGPPLAVPDAPPRVLTPVDEPLAEAPPPQEEPTTPQPATNRPPTTTRTQRPRPTNTPAAPTAAVPETPPDAAAPTPPPADQPAAPRAVPTQADAAAERQVRDKIRKSTSDLGSVDYKKLSAQGQQQYDLAKRFIDQAEAQLRDRNYTLAGTVADKAAELATQLLASR